MKSSLAITCALAVACALAASPASAAPNLTVFVQSVTLPAGTTSGFFDVAVTNTGSAIATPGITTRVYQDIVNPDIVFGTPVPTTNFTPIFISDDFATPNGTLTNTASDVSDNYETTDAHAVTLGATPLGLMEVPFTILNGFMGTVQIDINSDNIVGTSLVDTGFNYLSYTPESGDIIITPEPASLLLMALGVPLVLRRRTRR